MFTFKHLTDKQKCKKLNIKYIKTLNSEKQFSAFQIFNILWVQYTSTQDFCCLGNKHQFFKTKNNIHFNLSAQVFNPYNPYAFAYVHYIVFFTVF